MKKKTGSIFIDNHPLVGKAIETLNEEVFAIEAVVFKSPPLLDKSGDLREPLPPLQVVLRGANGYEWRDLIT